MMIKKAEKRKTRDFFLNKWIIMIVLMTVILLGMIGFIVSSLWYSHQCNMIYNQVTDCVGDKAVTIYGEYNGQMVEIAYENRNSIWDTITDKMVVFTSANKMPAQQPVIIRFDDYMKIEVYPTESKDLFVKHLTGKTIKYYYIKNACDFTYLQKMVSLEGWNVPNMIEE